MPKLGGSRYADLTAPQGVTPVYWKTYKQIKALLPGREEGWEILSKIVTNCKLPGLCPVTVY